MAYLSISVMAALSKLEKVDDYPNTGEVTAKYTARYTHSKTH